ncbi:hypothetical protein [Metasolibacillus meyeri]|uniref:hypothetical protein n=1 Tax=Metasolibacillus meyeri TaxID=1071052 RepID=UPI000D31A1AD|nr:hypothetical protein [Metasolibacillus meyeri]
MMKLEMIVEQQPIHISHDTYRRECRYTRGIHIPADEFSQIMKLMAEDTKLYFEFHNVAKKIEPGSYLNGHSSLARQIDEYYKKMKNTEIIGINNGQDFYVKLT